MSEFQSAWEQDVRVTTTLDNVLVTLPHPFKGNQLHARTDLPEEDDVQFSIRRGKFAFAYTMVCDQTLGFESFDDLPRDDSEVPDADDLYFYVTARREKRSNLDGKYVECPIRVKVL